MYDFALWLKISEAYNGEALYNKYIWEDVMAVILAFDYWMKKEVGVYA